MADEPERYTFIWLDHQKYHADAQTIALLWQIKSWDRSPDQAAAHVAFDHAQQQGQVLEGPVSHHELAAHHHDRTPIDPNPEPARTETITYRGREFRATPRVVERLDNLHYESSRRREEMDPSGGEMNQVWADEPRHQYQRAIRQALQEGTLKYVGRVDHRELTVNGIGGTPWQNETLAQEEHQERVLVNEMRTGVMGMTGEGVRHALGMEPEEAVQRGLILAEDIGDGETGYRAVTQRESTVTHEHAFDPGHSL
jgi:hypothetical protein